MSNRDLQILTLWKTLSEREKQEVLKKIQARAERERGQKEVLSSASERQRLQERRHLQELQERRHKQDRQLRPVWRFALDTVNALGTALLFYVLIVSTLLLA